MKKNIIANYFGQGWNGLMGLAFVPLYIRHMGAEAYGLVGLFVAMQAWLALLDIGLTPTLNREMARFLAGTHTSQSIRNLLRTMELIYLLLASLAVALIWLGAPFLANQWLHSEKLSPADITSALWVIGIVVVLRWLEGLYKGAIQGLQQQVWLNVIYAIASTVRWGGAAAIIVWVDPSINAFYIWQAFASVLTLIALYAKLYLHLPKGLTGARFSLGTLKPLWRFSGGVVAITIMALLLTQVDKILLSRLLSLEDFGYYSFAASIGAGLTLLIAPLTNAMYPRFAEMIAKGQTGSLINSYHRSCQLMSAMIIAPALTFAFFSEPTIFLWSDDAALAATTAPIASLLVLGTLCNGLVALPYTLQLAHGWTALTVKVNLIAVALIIPAIIVATPRYGAIGAAYCWLILNAGYVSVAVYFMHRRLLIKEMKNWYLKDIGAPLLAGSIVGIAIRVIFRQIEIIAKWQSFEVIVVAFSAIFASAWLATELGQQAVGKRIMYWARVND